MPRGDDANPSRVLKLVAALAVLAGAAGAQRPAIGQAAPLLPLRDLDGREVALSSLMGERGLVVLFWAGWSERSVEALHTLERLRADVAPRGVAFAAVNVEHEHLAAEELSSLRSMVNTLNVGFPVLVDDGLKLFRAYGVVSVPSIAVVARDGTLARFLPGFSATQRETVVDAVHDLAGITRTAVVAPPKGVPAALRWLLIGRSQVSGNRDASARASFERAARLDPSLADPLIELAALALDGGDTAGAKTLLDQALARDADAPAAIREWARLDALEGRTDQAIVKLKPLAGAARDLIACEYLGLLLRARDPTAAAAAFDCAARAGGADDAARRARPLAEAMRLYRRAAERPR